MNDIRRTILWVIFGFSMVLLWDQWQIYNGHKATFFPKPVAATAENTAASNTPAASGSVPTASSTAGHREGGYQYHSRRLARTSTMHPSSSSIAIGSSGGSGR